MIFVLVVAGIFQITLSDKIYLLIGPSQSGKSSFINHNLKCIKPIQTGDETRESVTKDIRAYSCRENLIFQNELVTLIDTPGYFDSNVSISDDQIMHEIEVQILSIVSSHDFKQIDGVLLFDSVSEAANKNQHMILRLQQIFDDKILQSTVLIINKVSSLIFEEQLDRTVSKVKKFCNKYLIHGPVKYDTEYDFLSYSDLQKIKANYELKSILKTLDPYSSERFQQNQQRLMKKFNELKYINQSYKETTSTTEGNESLWCEPDIQKLTVELTSKTCLFSRGERAYSCKQQLSIQTSQFQNCVKFKDIIITNIKTLKISDELRKQVKNIKMNEKIQEKIQNECKSVENKGDNQYYDEDQKIEICGQYTLKTVNLTEEIQLYDDDNFYMQRAKEIIIDEIKQEFIKQI